VGMAHGGAPWRCSSASGRLRPIEHERRGASGSLGCGDQNALTKEEKEGRGGRSARTESSPELWPWRGGGISPNTLTRMTVSVRTR